MAAFVIAAAVAAGTAGTVAASIAAGTLAFGFSMTAFVSAVVLGGLSKALAKSPSAPGSGGAGAFQSEGRMTTIRQAVTPWQVIVGQARVAGALTFYWESADREYVHFVITFACHECESIDEIYFDEHLVPLDANGEAFGRWSKVSTDQAITNYQAVIDGSAQITVPGFGLLHNAAIVSIVPNLTDVSPRAPATYAEFSRVGNVFTFHTSMIGRTASVNHYAQSTTESSVRVRMSLGDEAASEQPFPDLVAETAGAWSSAHKQYGHCKVYFRLQANQVAFPNGIPNITAVIRGAKIYDPRTAGTEWSANAPLWVSHYLTESAAPYGFGADYDEEIHEDDLIAAANISDEEFTRASGGVERRYEVNGAFTTSEKPKDVLTRLLSACGGNLCNIGGQWRINVAAYNAPTVTLAENDLAGPSTVSAHLPTQESCNGVKGVYTNRFKGWQADDFPPVSSDSALDEDGERNWKDVDLTAFVVDSGQAQRLAKIDLLRTRQSLTEVALFKLPAWQCIPGKTVARTDEQYGWTAKVFEIVDAELSIMDSDGGAVMAVQLTLRETAAAVYDFATNEDAQGDIAPNTALPDPGVVPAPGTPSIAEENYETRDGRGVATKAIVTYALSAYPFGALHQLEYRLTSASSYTALPPVRHGEDDTIGTQEIPDVAPGRYDFRVRAIGVTGAVSSYMTASNREIVGLSDVPEDPVILGMQPDGTGTKVTMTLQPHPALDVRRGGRWRIRHTDGDTPLWEGTFSIGAPEGYVGDQTIIELPLKPGSYCVKAEDALGQLSAGFASFYLKQAAVIDFTAVHTITEDTAFTGAKSGVVAVDGLLKLDCDGMVDDVVDWDSLSAVDSIGGLLTEGTYTFANLSNFGAVTRVRLTGLIVGQAVNVNDLLDDRIDDVDTWADFDGDDSGGGLATDAWIEFAQTDDDPTGTPAWSDWSRLDTTVVEAWGVKYRLQMRTTDTSYNRHVNQLRVVAEEAA